MRERRRRHATPSDRRVRAATISGSLAATAAFGMTIGASPADAATFDAALVKDINVNPSGSSSPRYLTDIGGMLFFGALDGPDNGTTHGNELWASDGTGPGTQLVKDINPSGNSYPYSFAGLGGIALFRAYDGPDNGTTYGRELWRSDGTAPNTALVKDIDPAGSGDPYDLKAFGANVFFSADDGTNGYELWKSDGTEPNTQMVKDINASGGSYPFGFTDLGGTILFAAYDGPENGTTTDGDELWKTDGTEPNTQLVKDINPGGGGNPESLTDVGGTLFFQAYDGADNGTTRHGQELWKSDGTGPGTQLVKDIRPGSGSFPRFLTDVGGTLLFQANDGTNGAELWRSDGTTGGTQLVKDIRSGSGSSYPNDLIDVGGTLFFTAFDGAHGRELWRSDPPFTDAQLVKDIRPGPGYSSYPDYLTDVGGTLFFAAGDGVYGQELWASDGTAAGTQMVKDINPSGNSSPDNLAEVGDTLFFVATDGTTGRELWKAFTVPSPPPPGGTTGTPTTPVAAPPAFDLKAAIRKCKKKFPKGPKRKKCIKKAKARARA